MTHLRLISAVAFLLYCVCAQVPESVDKMKCYNDRSEPIRCVPEFINAAYRRKVASNNTCGTPPSKYCAQTLSTGQKKQCQTCDSRYEATRHIPYYITDVKDDKNYSWWQSDTLFTFQRNHIFDRRSRLSKVVLTLDLGKTFEIVSIRLRFRSLRPESMAIFKQTTSDKDGPWIPYQYYSRACEDFYRIKPDDIIVGRDDLQTALCTAKYSQVVPIFGGEVLFGTLANRPGRNEIERLPQLQEWIRAYSLKFELDRLNTFADDIFGDPDVLRSYYYAITDLTVVGKCHCNGHASECKNKTEGGNYICQCQHNTTGVDCERCLPTHNNKPWGMATTTNAHACEAGSGSGPTSTASSLMVANSTMSSGQISFSSIVINSEPSQSSIPFYTGIVITPTRNPPILQSTVPTIQQSPIPSILQSSDLATPSLATKSVLMTSSLKETAVVKVSSSIQASPTTSEVLPSSTLSPEDPSLESDILSGKTYYWRLLKMWIGGNSTWKLCWRATRDGWAAKTFHSNCDYKKRTVTLVKVGQYIFGGYATASWEGFRRWKKAGGSFIFSLRNKENLSPFTAPLKDENTRHAIYADRRYGPTFGYGHDLYIADNAASSTPSHSSTYFNTTYQPPSGVSEIIKILAGTFRFSPSQVEVFYLV